MKSPSLHAQIGEILALASAGSPLLNPKHPRYALAQRLLSEARRRAGEGAPEGGGTVQVSVLRLGDSGCADAPALPTPGRRAASQR